MAAGSEILSKLYKILKIVWNHLKHRISTEPVQTSSNLIANVERPKAYISLIHVHVNQEYIYMYMYMYIHIHVHVHVYTCTPRLPVQDILKINTIYRNSFLPVQGEVMEVSRVLRLHLIAYAR